MLKNDFNYELSRVTTTAQSANEIQCFTALSKALSKNNYVYTETVHGLKGLVEHNLKHSHTIGHRQKCEMADLLIIFMSNKGNIRYTFLQNKRDRKITYSPTSPLKRIHATPIQWDLLHYKCPLISAVASSNFPKNCLSNAILDSVGTYGIFVNDSGASTVDMSYSIASDMILTSKAPINGKHKRSITINSNYGTIRTVNGYDEIEGTKTLNQFEIAGKAMLIGTPLTPEVNEECKNLAEDIVGLAKACLQKQPNDYLSSKIDRYIQNNELTPNVISNNIVRSVVIIDAYDNVIYLTENISNKKINVVKNFFGDSVTISKQTDIKNKDSLIIYDEKLLKSSDIRLPVELNTGNANHYIAKIIGKELCFTNQISQF